MDTLSSSVSSFKVPTLHYSTSRDLFHFKILNTSYHHQQPHPNFSSPTPTNKPNSITKKTTTSSFAHKSVIYSPISSSNSTATTLNKRSPVFHSKAASGYAAALIDVGRCSNSLEKLEKDVGRLSRWLRGRREQFMDEKEKGKGATEVAEKGKFHGHLVRLLKMLGEKNKVGMVSQVLEEFERIYDELSGTTRALVLDSSAMKMEEADADYQLSGIAKRVQQLSGATTVKLRRFVVDTESFLSPGPAL